MLRRRDGRLLGGEKLGPGVEPLAHLLAYAVEAGSTAQAMCGRSIYHPTVEEELATDLSQIVQKTDLLHDDSGAS